MVTFKSESLFAMLLDEPDVFRKPYGALLSLVCPHPDAHDPLALGLRVGTHEQPIIGVDGGEGGSSVMDVGAKVWWVVEPLAGEIWPPMMCYSTGQIEIYRVNVEFAGSPSEAVDYLVRTPMHASAAIFGATICATKDYASVVVGDLGVAISIAGPAQAGRGGVAISTYPDVVASAGQSGIAIGCTHHGIAISGVCGQSYTGRDGVSRSGSCGIAVAGSDGHATGSYVVVGDRGEAEVLVNPNAMFAAGVDSRVRADGFVFHAGKDYDPGVAYRVRFLQNERPSLERYPELDAFVDHAQLNTNCDLTNHALIRYFLDERPLCSAAAHEHGVWWTHDLRNEHGVLELPPGTREYLDEIRRPYRTGAG